MKFSQHLSIILAVFWACISSAHSQSLTPNITTSSPLASGTVGFDYSQTVSATGGATPYTWAISAGKLPAGLTMNTSGVISGKPTAVVSASFTVKVTGGGVFSTKVFTISIGPPAPTITTGSPLTAGAVGVSYSKTLVATAGATPYTWASPPGICRQV